MSRTAVNRAHPAINAILSRALPAWSSRRIEVVVVDDDWNIRITEADNNTSVDAVLLDDDAGVDGVMRLARPDPAMPVAVYTPRTSTGALVVLSSRNDGVPEVVIPRRGWRAREEGWFGIAAADCCIDDDAVAVATDIVLQGGPDLTLSFRKRGSISEKVWNDVSAALTSCGIYAGLASAIAYGQAKILTLRHQAISAIDSATEVYQVDDALATLGRKAGTGESNRICVERGGMREMHRAAIARRLGKSADKITNRKYAAEREASSFRRWKEQKSR